MNYTRHMKLRRKTFDQLIEEAYQDYLFDEGIYKIPGNKQDEFNPADVLNRNLEQVPWGIWRMLLFRHLHKHFYN